MNKLARKLSLWAISMGVLFSFGSACRSSQEKSQNTDSELKSGVSICAQVTRRCAPTYVRCKWRHNELLSEGKTREHSECACREIISSSTGNSEFCLSKRNTYKKPWICSGRACDIEPECHCHWMCMPLFPNAKKEWRERYSCDEE